MKMFERVRAAVEALKNLSSVRGYRFGNPLLSTEVYNEGWMLRLLVAKLHDTREGLVKALADPGENAAVQTIARLSRRGWCSEGELFPTFKGEGTTKADGIVGNITPRLLGSGRNTKWGFECESGEFRVLEAKMKSPLSAGTKNLKNYDQAARYVGCIAMMEARHLNKTHGGLIVLGPESKRGNAKQKIEGAKTTISSLDASPRNREDFGSAKSLISGVVERSVFLSWDHALNALPADDDKAYICSFYETAKKMNGL